MPKLKNAKEKYVNGLKVDKETKDVIYSDAAHAVSYTHLDVYKRQSSGRKRNNKIFI